MNFNWIDWVILGVVLYHAYLGWEAGFFPLLVNFLSFLLALWVAVTWQVPVSGFLSEKFGIPHNWSAVLSYLLLAFFVQETISELLHGLLTRIPKRIRNSKIAESMGAVVSAANGLVIVAFVLLVVLALPLRGTVKTDIKNSRVGSILARYVEKYGAPIESVIEEIGKSAQKFFTIEPESKERIALEVSPKFSDLRVDEASERKMLELVNAERAKTGAPALVMDTNIVAVARAYSRDMFERKYFSHYSPEGENAADRMEKGGVTFTLAGENLAYAPDVTTAHQGLMESAGHRRNILDRRFRRIGIGIIATDTFGIMVTQNFAD